MTMTKRRTPIPAHSAVAVAWSIASEVLLTSPMGGAEPPVDVCARGGVVGVEAQQGEVPGQRGGADAPSARQRPRMGHARRLPSAALHVPPYALTIII